METQSGATVSGTTLSSGEFDVLAGGSASGTIVSGGAEYVSLGGTENGTTVLTGGFEFVFGTAIGDTVNSGGTERVFGGAHLSGATVNGGFVELLSGGTAGTSQINFTLNGGTLQLDDSVHFDGTISGFGVPGGIDLRDISFASSGFSLGYSSSTSSSGTLTVTDGTNTATLHLLGQYVAGNFTAQADGNGGTLITDPPVAGYYSLYNPRE